MTITAHQSWRASCRALVLSLLALGALGLVACSVGDDDDERATEATLSPEQEIEQVGNEWAPIFAGRERFCELMTQPACERAPSLEFRKSFADATVKDVAITGGTAAARFSNGETVELERVNIPDPLAEDGDRFGWLIHRVGGNAGDVAFITRVGNAWAPLFAEDNSAACEFMFGQPLCEEFFGHVGEPPEVGRPSAFQRSFTNATVERVELSDVKRIRAVDRTPIGLHRATAEFSNGEVVGFIEETDAPRSDLGKWFVHDVGESARATTEAKLSQEQVQELKREANTWASLFAINASNRYMSQPISGQLYCRREMVGPPIENCTPVSAAFQTSFADATVEDIKSERIVQVGWTDRPLYEAAVKFSNGEVVVFAGLAPGAPEPRDGSCAGGAPGESCSWNIAGADVNRRFIEAATTPP